MLHEVSKALLLRRDKYGIDFAWRFTYHCECCNGGVIDTDWWGNSKDDASAESVKREMISKGYDWTDGEIWVGEL